MSPLWNPRHYKLYLTRTSLNWVACGWFGKILDAGQIPFTAGQSLSAALQSLPQPAPVHDLILSDAYMRYLVLDWPQGINQHIELQAYLEGGFAEVYGSGWVLQWHVSPDAQRTLVCGMPSKLADDIELTWLSRKPDVRPLLSTVLQGLPRTIRQRTNQLLILESDQLTFTVSHEQSWHSVTSLSSTNVHHSMLASRIRQEQRASPALSAESIRCLSVNQNPRWLADAGLAVEDLKAALPGWLLRLLAEGAPA